METAGAGKRDRGHRGTHMHVEAEEGADDDEDEHAEDVADDDGAVGDQEGLDVPDGAEGMHHAGEHGDADAQGRQHAVEEEEQEELVVEEADAVADPEAVVVHLQHALVADVAVVAARGLRHLAPLAPPGPPLAWRGVADGGVPRGKGKGQSQGR